MRQKIDDVKAFVKNDRRAWFGLGFIGFILLIWTFTSSNQHQQRYQRPSQMKDMELANASSQSVDTADPYNDLIRAFRNDVEKLTKLSQSQDERVERLGAEFKSHQERVSGVFETIVDKFEGLEREVDTIKNRQVNEPAVGTAPATGPNEVFEQDTLEPIGFETTDLPPPPAPPKLQRATVISPGDSVKVALLTGVNAPVDGTPYPVVFKLLGPINGPDGSSLDIGEARLIAAAQGSEVDSRAIFRVTQLALRHKDGRRSVVDVDGWIVGEDGVRGMPGRLIDKLGRLIAATGGVSFAAALGERLTDNANVDGNGNGLVITTDDTSFATAQALSDASNRIGQILLDRYESMVPVVEVLSGREAAAIFSRLTEVEIYEEDPGNEDIYGLQRVSLD